MITGFLIYSALAAGVGAGMMIGVGVTIYLLAQPREDDGRETAQAADRYCRSQRVRR